MNTPLSKKTKAELISAYKELQMKQTELEGATQQTYAEEPSKVIEKAEKEHTINNIEKTVGALRDSASSAISQFAQTFEQQVRRFEELKKASTLLEERVKVLRTLEAGAEMGAQLLNTLETERMQLEQEIATKRREWERTQEEIEYHAKVVRKREEEEATEERRKKEAVLKDREQVLFVKEKDMADKVKKLETFDAEIEKETERRLTVAKTAWETEHNRELTEKDRERELEEKLHTLEMKTVREDVKRLETECASLRKDAEQANKRAQDLALKIVEGGSRERTNPTSVATATEK